LTDAVATQNTITQLVAATRRVRRLVPAARGVAVAAHDYDRAGKPQCAWDDPQAAQALVSGLVNDALALVAGKDVEPGERPGSWRTARKVAKDRVISTVDPQARHTRKTAVAKRDGSKGHIAAEPESGPVSECALTAANAPDGPTGSRGWPRSSRGWRYWPVTAGGGPPGRWRPPVGRCRCGRRSGAWWGTAKCRLGRRTTAGGGWARSRAGRQ
jgi:hypothetical protein